MVLTPEVGDAATTSWPSSRSLFTSFVPMSPLPPITTIFMLNLLVRSPQVGACDVSTDIPMSVERPWTGILWSCHRMPPRPLSPSNGSPKFRLVRAQQGSANSTLLWQLISSDLLYPIQTPRQMNPV